MKVRIGVIGAGRMGAVYVHHLSYSLPEAEAAAIADIHPERCEKLASEYPIGATYADANEMLRRDDIDAVIVASPTNTHSEWVQKAAEAGKHIFCEKPLALNLADCDTAIEAVRAAKVKLQIGFMRRFDAPYAQAKKLIDEGKIGRPVMFKSTGRDPRRTSLEYAKREKSGGLIADMGVHDFDLARWLMGSEVVRVFSEGACLVYPELQDVGDIDNAVVNLKFENGAVGNVDLSRNAVYGYDIRTEILGSEGGLLIGKLQQTALLVMTRNGVTHDTVPYFMQRFADAYAAEIRHFVACIREDRQPMVTGEDGRAATAIGEAATRSLDEQRPVEVEQ